jgi:hypothetical protein
MTLSSPSQNPLQPIAKPLLAAALLFSLTAILLDASGVKSLLSNPASLVNSPSRGKAIETLAKECKGEINETAKLSRKQLLQLLAVPERDSKARVREIVQAPYCQLSSLQVRAGVDAVREAYPLEFDAETTLVLLYENDEYAGYRFRP